MTIGWGETGDAAAVLEAFYRLDLDEQPWLEGARRSVEALTPGSGVLASAFSWVPGQSGFQASAMAGPPGVSARAVETADQADAAFIEATMASAHRVYVLSQLFGERLPAMAVSRLLNEFGAVDLFNLQAVVTGAVNEGVIFGAASGRRIELSAPGLAVWHRVAGHLAAAVRLRRDGLDVHPIESVLTPDGRVQHAEGTARDEEKREALTRAVRAIERARRRDARTDPGEVLEAWRAIVERRWSLIDVVESDGRRFMLARVNPPAASDHPALTPREKQVAALLAQGVPQKVIGYELSMSPSTVAFHVKNAARKLGLSTSTELVRALAARGAGG